MKRITQYQCEICKAIFDKKQQAIDCEGKVAPIFNFAIGEMVAVEHYDPNGKKYAGVKVVQQIVSKNTHEKGYELSDVVRTTEDKLFLGTTTDYWADNGRGSYYVARESDLHKFYNIDRNQIEIYE